MAFLDYGSLRSHNEKLVPLPNKATNKQVQKPVEYTYQINKHLNPTTTGEEYHHICILFFGFFSRKKQNQGMAAPKPYQQAAAVPQCTVAAAAG